VADQCIKEKWHDRDHQGIQLDGGCQIPVEQLVETPSGSATWTSKTCERAKWTERKKPRTARLEDEQIDSGDHKRKPNSGEGKTSIYYLSYKHETADPEQT